jgi:hypothetical protein
MSDETMTFPISYELSRAIDTAKEAADLQLAGIRLSGPELDALEQMERDMAWRLVDKMLYGNSFETADGKRVDPATVRPARAMKAADIVDADILEAVRGRMPSAIGWTIAREAFSSFPEKVVLAKLRQLWKRKLIQGCPCGCRGDWNLTDAGQAALSDACAQAPS